MVMSYPKIPLSKRILNITKERQLLSYIFHGGFIRRQKDYGRQVRHEIIQQHDINKLLLTENKGFFLSIDETALTGPY